MNTTLLAFLGWPEIMGILIVVLVLFGAKRVPELMRGMGQGLREFKKATRDVQDELEQAIEDEPPPPRPKTRPPSGNPQAQKTTSSDSQVTGSD